MSERQSVKIKIFGTEYVLKGDSDPQYMHELAQLVDNKMRQLGDPGTVQINRVAILAAFQFADELTKVRRTLDTERQSQDKTARTLAQLDLKIQEALHHNALPSANHPGLSMEEAESVEEKTPSPDRTPENPDDASNDHPEDLNWK